MVVNSRIMSQPPSRPSRRPTRTLRRWRQRPGPSLPRRRPTGVEGAQPPWRVNLGSRPGWLGSPTTTPCRGWFCPLVDLGPRRAVVRTTTSLPIAAPLPR
eukprot:8353998-Lingulodinium_polyedra.AAC.1